MINIQVGQITKKVPTIELDEPEFRALTALMAKTSTNDRVGIIEMRAIVAQTKFGDEPNPDLVQACKKLGDIYFLGHDL